MRQHLTAVRQPPRWAAPRSRGAESASRERSSSRRRESRRASYRFSVGTAGSATLVLQTVLPALLTAARPSTLVLEGGTHNPLAPPFDFLGRRSFPLFARMGARVERHARTATGSTRRAAAASTSRSRRPGARARWCSERGEVRARRVRAIVANLPGAVGERELNRFAALGRCWDSSARSRIEVVPGPRGPGQRPIAVVESEHVTEVFTGFGEKQVSPRGRRRHASPTRRSPTCDGRPSARTWPTSSCCCWRSRARARSARRGPTTHTRTQLDVIPRFLSTAITCTGRRCDRTLPITAPGERLGRRASDHFHDRTPATDLGFLLHKHPARVQRSSCPSARRTSSIPKRRSSAARRRCCWTSIPWGSYGSRGWRGDARRST